MQSVNGKQKIVLGQISAPSGTVLLIDFGLMYLWTHDRPPLLPEGLIDEQTLASANNGFDLAIEGKDAEAAGKKFGRQPNPLYLYDIPAHGFEELAESFAKMAQAEGFDARLKKLSQRVSPLERAKQALARGKSGGAELFLHGVNALVFSGLPKNKPLEIVGETLGEGDFADNWKHIALNLNPSNGVSTSSGVSTSNDEAEVKDSLQLGYVCVDMARLMFCDLDAAGLWLHEESKDGLADFVFWGRDGARLAQKFKAKQLEGGIFGFPSIPVDEAAELAFKVQEHLERHHLVAACDFRPHSDHWRLLTAISRSEREAGAIELGESTCLGFMTSWGDGFFPVFLDMDETGKPLRLRVEFATEETLSGMRMVNRFN